MWYAHTTLPTTCLFAPVGDIDDLMEMVQAGLLPGGSDTATPVAASGSGSGSSASNQKARLSPRWDALNAVQARRHIAMRGHCSALVKVSALRSDPWVHPLHQLAARSTAKL